MSNIYEMVMCCKERLDWPMMRGMVYEVVSGISDKGISLMCVSDMGWGCRLLTNVTILI